MPDVKNKRASFGELDGAASSAGGEVTYATPDISYGTPAEGAAESTIRSDATIANPAFEDLTPLTTKGDLLGRSTLSLRIPVGNDDDVLTADAAQAAGIKWAAPAVASVDFSKGALIELPDAADPMMPFYFTPVPITVNAVDISIDGSVTPSWTVNVRHSTNRGLAGNALWATATASAQAANFAESSGHHITAFDDNTIPANSWIWADTEAVSGTLLTGIVMLRCTPD